jgi:hypothetical protein
MRATLDVVRERIGSLFAPPVGGAVALASTPKAGAGRGLMLGGFARRLCRKGE